MEMKKLNKKETDMKNLNLTYKVFQDSFYDKDNLQNWLDEMGAVFLYKNDRYDFVGENIHGDVVEYLLDMANFSEKQIELLDRKFDGIHNNEALEYLVGRIFGELCLNVYMYDHSGVSISTSSFGCSWDSGMLGIIGIVDKDKFRKSFPTKRINTKKALNRLDSWIEEINHYLIGNCWGFIIEDENGDVVDSCGGFVGDFEDLVSDMAYTADTPDELEVIKQKLLEAYNNLY